MRRYIPFLGLVICHAAPLPAGAEGINVGTLVGAGLGGVIGNQIGKGTGNTVATVAGVILGGVAGHAVDRDWNGVQHIAPQPSYYAPPVYQGGYSTVQTIGYRHGWDDSHHRRGRGHAYGHRYRRGDHYERYPEWQRPVLLPARPVVYAPPHYSQNYPQPVAQPAEDEGYCREYTHRVVVGNRVQDSYGTACLQPDGSWRVVR